MRSNSHYGNREIYRRSAERQLKYQSNYKVLPQDPIRTNDKLVVRKATSKFNVKKQITKNTAEALSNEDPETPPF